jgi:hypothetical protein
MSKESLDVDAIHELGLVRFADNESAEASPLGGNGPGNHGNAEQHFTILKAH